MASVAISPWATALAMYLFGIATGWLIWGRRRAGVAPIGEPKLLLDAGAAGETPMSAANAAALGALEKEIRDARALLEHDEGETATFAEALAAVDESIKRANGRLKLLARAVKKGSSAS